MKKLFTIFLVSISFSVRAQSITVDSLNNIIINMQKQIAALQKVAFLDTTTFLISQFTVTNVTPTNRIVSLKVGTDLTPRIAALEIKVAGLKATSITTTVIK